MEVSMQEINKYLDGLALSPIMRKRVKAILKELGANGFEKTTGGQWEGAYKRVCPARPNRKYSLGKETYKVLAGVQKFIGNARFTAQVEHSKEVAETRAAENRVQSLEEKARSLEARKEELERAVLGLQEQAAKLTCTFTRKQMRVIADEMELHGLDFVNLAKINAFWETWGFAEVQEGGRSNEQ